MAKKTPLYDVHVKLGGKIVEYAGWLLPVQYEGLVPEHNAVRNQLGVFDVSHMGEVTVKGEDAIKFVDYLFTNDLSKIGDNQVIYGYFCMEDGNVVDDLLVYRIKEDYLYLVINGANVEKDFKWIQDHIGDFKVEVENLTEVVAEIAVQGPLAEKVVQKLTDYDLSTIPFFGLVEKVKIAGTECMISRTGYTGEDGFEIYSDNEGIVVITEAIFEAGKEEGVKPCGLGCRDTLRFEAALPLYGHEISDTISPLEGGFKFFVALDKPSDFIGKEALNKQYNDGLKRIVCGLQLLERGIPREGYEVFKDGKKIGFITTGYLSPTLGTPIANVLIDPEYKALGTEVEVMIRNKPVKANIISKRFLKKNTKTK